MPLLDRSRLKLKNAGRAQFSAVREEILALLAEGYSRHALYAELYAKGAFSGSYRCFCEYVQEMETQRGNRESESATGTAKATPPAMPEKIAPKPPANVAGTAPPAVPERPAPQPAAPENPAPQPSQPETPMPQPIQPEKPAAGGFTHIITPNINDLI